MAKSKASSSKASSKKSTKSKAKTKSTTKSKAKSQAKGKTKSSATKAKTKPKASNTTTTKKAETKSSSAENKDKKSKNLVSKLLSFPIVVIILILFVAGVGAAAIIISDGELGERISDAVGSGSDNGVEEVEEYLKNGVLGVIGAMNFENLDENNPQILDVGAVQELIENSSDDLEYLRFDTPDLAGNTVHYAFDIKIDLDSLDQNAEIKLDLRNDLFVQYPEDYSNLENNHNLAAIFGLFEDLSAESVPNFALMSEFNIELEGEDVSGKLDLYGIDNETFLKIFDLRGVDDESIQAIEDLVINLRSEGLVNNLLESLSESVSEIEDSIPSLEDDSAFRDFEESFFGELGSEDIEILDRVGNPIRDVITDTVDNIDLFRDIDNIDPIREDYDGRCTEGSLNFVGIIEDVQRGYTDIIDILSTDEAYAGEDFDTMRDEINTTFDDLFDSFNDLNIKADIRTCNNSQVSFGDPDIDYFTGFGVDLGADISFVGDLDVEFDFLVVDFASDFEIEAPEFDVTLTEEDLDQLNLDDLFDISNLSGWGTDLPLLFDGFGSGSSLDSFDLGDDADSFLDDFGSDGSSEDSGGLSEFEELFNDSEVTQEQIDELVNRYLEGEIDFEEYLQQYYELYGIE